MTHGTESRLAVERWQRAVVAEMARAFDGLEPARFYRLLTYHLGQTDEAGASLGDGASSGKLLRPTLCLLGCAAVGGEPELAVPAAAAIELIHCFSLLHDDVEDRSEARRHRRTVWSLWGEAQAINAGDAMFVLAQLAMLRSVERGVAPDRAVAVARAINEACLRICEGQFLDLEAERGAALDEAAYLDLIGRKTAALVACPLEVGALIGGGKPEQVRGLRDFGRLVGLAYQMQDDVLGIWGDPAVTGKPAHDDLRSRKQSLPVLHAGLPRPPAGAPTLADDAEVAAALAWVEAAGSRAYTEARAEDYLRQAAAALDTTPPLAAEPRHYLETTARALVGRAR